ncbi:MAG: FUSC family protein [Acetobacteraceae bacterium]|nr:FUSC family protein [Acetobacteraceae bacterium]
MTLPLPGLREWQFSAVTFAAAALALYIAFRLDLPRPYWAATTVYIVAQPSSGALLAKALWRFVGTLAGGTFAVLAVPNLVDAPPLLVLAFALWVGLCLVASLRDPTPRSYAFMLAGYTAAIIGFPSVDEPGAIFDTALSRAEEISLGIACAYLLHSIFLPRPAAPLLLRRLRAWTGDVAQFGMDALSGRLDTTSFTNDRRRLARDGAALDAMFHQARYETGSRAALLWLPALRDRARWVPAIVTAAAERIATLRAADPAALNALAPLLDEVTSWMARTIETAPQAGTDLSARRLLIRLEQEQAAATGDWPGLVREGLLARLRELVETWSECLDRSRRILAAEPAGPEQEPQIRRPGSTDPLLVALSGVAAALAIIGTCAFWILTASPAGSIAALMAAVASSIFAQLDDPAPAIARFISGNAASVVVAGFYLFAVLPAIDGFPLLIVALGAFFLPAAAFQAVPSLTARLTPVTLNTFAMMSLQENYAADFPSLLESGLAMLLGIGFALWATRLVRSFGISLRVSRLVQADRRDLAWLAEGRHPADLRRIAAAMLDRFEAVAARLGAADARAFGVRELADLRAALNVLRLREVTGRLESRARRLVEDALTAVAAQARGREPAEGTLARLDAALAVLTASGDRRARSAALALSGLRMAWFPAAPPPAVAPGPAMPPNRTKVAA